MNKVGEDVAELQLTGEKRNESSIHICEENPIWLLLKKGCDKRRVRRL